MALRPISAALADDNNRGRKILGKSLELNDRDRGQAANYFYDVLRFNACQRTEKVYGKLLLFDH